MKFNIIVLFIILMFCCRYVQCNYEIPGETLPHRVEIEVGDSINISCYMNPRLFPNRTAHDLFFINAYTHERVPESDIVVINNTTIVYMLQNAREHQTSYRCQCGDDAIMDTKVFVGHKPQAIQDFNCRAYDYVSMQCNFTKLDNPVLTQYNLSIYFGSKYKIFPICDYDKPPLVICLIFNQYRPHEEIYYYELISTNALGTYTQHFNINNTKVMVLAAPGQDFITEEITTHSAKFSFRIKNYESYRSKRLQWDVALTPVNFSSIDLSSIAGQIPMPRSRSQSKFELRLENLEYAYYSYEIKLRVRLQATNAWSDSFTYTFRTEARRPDRPPHIDVGSFHTDPSEQQIRLYWELLQPYEKNGVQFTYYIERLANEEITNLKPILMESNSAVFLWEKEKEYNFLIRSQNEKGLSENASSIYIPAMKPATTTKKYSPPAVHNIYHETNDSYTLTWEAPEMSLGLLDYTVFWCRSKRALLNGCEGSIHFKHVRRDVRKFTTSPQTYTLNLAVSANYDDINTGMHWTECTMSEESDLVKMEPEVEATSSTTIKIQWGWEKVCPSILDNYNLSYCELAETDMNGTASNNCIDNGIEQYTHYRIIDKNVNRWELVSLKPYTRYKIEMFMYSLRKIGKKSDPAVVRTHESSPSPPRQLNVSRITNTSATLSWMPPSKRNGILRSYIIVLNDEKKEILIGPNNDFDETIVFELKNLTSSTQYKVYVLAKTVSTSEPSNDVHFLTLVGYPSMPGVVNSRDSNNNVTIEWGIPNGRVDYYEVAVTVKQSVTILKRRISFIKGANSCVLDIPKCLHNEHVTTVEVRTVNAASLSTDVVKGEDIPSLMNDIDEDFYDNEEELRCVSNSAIYDKQIASYRDSSMYRLYKSDWLLGPMYSCSAGTVGMIVIYIASVLLLGFGLIMALYLMRQRYNKMANITCILPAGLDAYMTKDFSGLTAVFPNEFTTSMKNEITNTQTENFTSNVRDFTQQNTSDYMLHNEEHCLLETTSHDSLFANEQTQSSNYEQEQTEKTEIESDTTDLKQKNDLNNSIPRKSTATAAESIPSSPYVQASNGMFTAPTSNCYIKPNALTQWQKMQAAQPAQANSFVSNGYIAVESIEANTPKLPNVNSNKPQQNLNTIDESGYVQPDALNKTKRNNNNNSSAAVAVNVPQQNSILQTNNQINCSPSGYTTIDQLSKMPAALRSNARNWESRNTENVNENPPSDLRPNICGYVTPRELTVFGQQQQQQQQQQPQNSIY